MVHILNKFPTRVGFSKNCSNFWKLSDSDPSTPWSKDDWGWVLADPLSTLSLLWKDDWGGIRDCFSYTDRFQRDAFSPNPSLCVQAQGDWYTGTWQFVTLSGSSVVGDGNNPWVDSILLYYTLHRKQSSPIPVVSLNFLILLNRYQRFVKTIERDAGVFR